MLLHLPRKLRVAFAAACAALGLASAAFAQCGGACAPGASCQVSNGAFESGSFSSWNQFGDTGNTVVFTGNYHGLTPHAGTYASAFGPTGGTGGISQVIAANPGDAIKVSFWYAAMSGGEAPDNSFSATIDGQTLVSLSNDTVDTTWSFFTFGVVSTSTNPTLVFTFFNSPAWDYLDDVSVCVTPACNGSCVSGSTCGGLNGGFETGNFAGWTQTGNTAATFVTGPSGAHGGGEYAAFGPSTVGAISQVIPAHVGDVVTVSFWYEAFNSSTTVNNSFNATFDGQSLVSFANDTAHTSWTHFSYPVISTSDNPTLSFTFLNAPSYDYLDDVSVCITPKCDGSCPSGSSCALINSGFEANSLGGWTQFGATDHSLAFATGFVPEISPHGGNYGGAFGPTVGPGGISQTVSANIGDEVSISFWYAAGISAGIENSFTATFDGQTVASFNNDASHTSWTLFTYSEIATSNNPTLAFTFFNEPDFDFLDDVTVCVTPNCGSACGYGSSCGGSNGGFETGSFAQWTQFGDTGFTDVEPGAGHSGGYGAIFGEESGLGGIRQTINAHTGDEVTITFWYAAGTGSTSTTNFFSAVFDSQTLVTFTDDTSHPNYTQFTFQMICMSDNPLLIFTFFNPPSFDLLDDVSVCVVRPSCAGACGAGTTCASANGGFETGDLADWPQFGDTSFTGVTSGAVDGVNPHGGSYMAYFGPNSSTGGISQAIPAHPGDHVTISFWYAARNDNGTNNAFSAEFDGQALVSFANDTVHTAFTHFTFPVIATSASPLLVFAFYNQPDYDLLDDVSVCITNPGVCCRGATCNINFIGPIECASSLVAGQKAGAHYVDTSACNLGSGSIPCCYGDYNKVNGINVQDIFDFLSDWFAGSHFARVGGDGNSGAVSVQNIFDFLRVVRRRMLTAFAFAKRAGTSRAGLACSTDGSRRNPRTRGGIFRATIPRTRRERQTEHSGWRVAVKSGGVPQIRGIRLARRRRAAAV